MDTMFALDGTPVNVAKTESHWEYSGFVKDTNTNEYVMLSRGMMSPLLAKNRAVEKAVLDNEYGELHFDTKDVILKRYVVETKESEMQEFECK